MSLEIKTRMLCDGDGCDAVIESMVEYRSTRASNTVWEVKGIAKDKKWINVSRGRRHTHTHYCPRCADKPLKPVPRSEAHKKRLAERKKDEQESRRRIGDE